jgi:hypothetical protein
VTLLDGTTRTDATQWFPEHGEAIGWAESTVTQEEADAFTSQQLEQLRQSKHDQLKIWWDSVEASSPTTLGFSIRADLQRLANMRIDVILATMRLQAGAGSETTVFDDSSNPNIVADADFVAAASTFDTEYKAKTTQWLTLRAAINAATTEAELNSVEIP